MSFFWFAVNFMWGALLLVLLAAQIRQIEPKNYGPMLGMVTAFAAIPAVLVPVLVGPLSDRCQSRFGRRKPFIMVGTVVAAIGLLGMLGFSAMWLSFMSVKAGYVASYFLVQVGMNIALGPYSSYIPDLVPVEQRGIAAGYMAVTRQAGTLFGAAVVAFVPAQPMYLILVGLLIAGALLLWLVIKEPEMETAREQHSLKSYLDDLWINPRRAPDFAWLWLTRFCVSLGLYCVQPFALYFVRDVLKAQDAPKATTLLLGSLILAATITGFIFGKLSDRIGRKKLVMNATIGAAVCVVGLAYCPTLPIAVFASTCFGLFFGAYLSVEIALGTDVIPDLNKAAKYLALYHVGEVLPQSISPILSGLLLSNLGQKLIWGEFSLASLGMTSIKLPDGIAFAYTPSGYHLTFVLGAVMIFIGGILVKKVRGST